MTFHQGNFDNGPSPIRKIEQQQENTALQIHAVFQSSYRIEAALLGVDDFPPLRRSAEDIKQSSTSFYGYFENEKLAAVTELKLSFGELDICSFVVDPEYFRMGIGSKLLDAVFAEFPNRNRIVETGADNLSST